MKKLTEIPARSAIADRPVGKAMMLDDLSADSRSRSVEESFERVLPQSPPTATPTAPKRPPAQPATTIPANTATQMLSTPISAEMKKKLNHLRLEHDISLSFAVEYALTQFFRGRETADIALELQERGGRLRRKRV